MTYNNNDERIYSVLNNKPEQCMYCCIDGQSPEPGNMGLSTGCMPGPAGTTQQEIQEFQAQCQGFGPNYQTFGPMTCVVPNE